MKKVLLALLIVASFLMMSFVGAAVQIFNGTGEWHTSDAETADMAMARAKQRAEKDAQKKAGVYLKKFSRSVNSELTDDEVSAVTNNIIEIVGNVQYDKKIISLSASQTTILYIANLKASIDPDGIFDFKKRDKKDKVIIIQQNEALQDAIQENDRLAESLTEQYNRATVQAEKDKIRKQMEQANQDFLANQKIEEANKLFRKSDYEGAIKLYKEALELNPNSKNAKQRLANVYFRCGENYSDSKQYELAIKNYTECLNFESYYYTYFMRGTTYNILKQYKPAIQDFSKAIELAPNENEDLYYSWKIPYVSYKTRGMAYGRLKQYELAIQDFNKLIESDFEEDWGLYILRGSTYFLLKKYELAIQDFDKSIEFLEPGMDFDAVAAYLMRGLCYQQIGDAAKARADFAKIKELNTEDSKEKILHELVELIYENLGNNKETRALLDKARSLGFNG